MNFVSCENIRRLAIVSSVFLVLGIALFAALMSTGSLSAGVFGISLLYIAFALILSSPLVLLVNLMLSILPGSRQKLEQCNH